MPRYYDVSVPLRTGMPIYPGNPQVSITLAQDMSKGASADVSQLDMGSHTGTHVDAPRHIVPGAESIDQVPLDALIGPARLIAFDDEVRVVDRAALERHDLRGVKRLLVRTRNSALLADDTFHSDYTYIAPDAAEYLVQLGVLLVGVDYLSIEQFHSGHHLTHKTLLGARVAIVEGLSLGEPAPGDYQLICLPLRIQGGDGAPARAVLVA
jgi:arylformamidase